MYIHYVNYVTIVHIVQDSLDSVEELLKKHEDFEKLLAAQEERFTQLNRETEVTVQSLLIYMHACAHVHVYMDINILYAFICMSFFIIQYHYPCLDRYVAK